MSSLPLATYVVLGLAVLLSGVLFALLPRLTRPDVYFAVTVEAAFRDSAEGRRIARGFRLWVLAATGLALALIVAARAWSDVALGAVAVIGQVIALVPAFLHARRRTLSFAAGPRTVREAPLEPRPAWSPGELLLHAGPTVIVIASAVLAAVRWSALPSRVPTHWGLNGEADQWVSRTPGTVAALLVSIAVVAAVTAFLSWNVGRGVRHIRMEEGAARAEHRFRRLMQAVTLVTSYLIALPAVLLALTTFGVQRWSPWLWLLPTLAILACVAIAAWWGQGGSRLPAGAGAERAPRGAPVGDRTDDRNWKAGLLYVNRGDPALLVEKRFGIGYTLNFGNPWSWVLLGLLLGVPLLLSILAGVR